MKRISLKYLVLTVLSLCLAGIFVVSWIYHKNPLFVAKVVCRAVTLNAIALGVKLYDPSPSVLKASVGPNHLENMERYGSSDGLSSLIRPLFPNQKINVIAFDNKPLTRSNYPFSYQLASYSGITRLQEKYNITGVVSAADNDFVKSVFLMNWVKSRWRHGTTGEDKFDPVKFDADVILSFARHGDMFWCHVYAMTFIQLASSVGIQSRLITLSHDGYSSEHAVAEAWSNQQQKWFVVDPDFNIWYSRNRIPLNVLEIHDLLMANKTSQIQINKGKYLLYPEFAKRIPSLYKFYRYFYVDMRNDWLSNQYFSGHPNRSDKATLFWVDKRLPQVLNLQTKTSNSHDLYWDLNRTELAFESHTQGGQSVVVDFMTLTPNFSYYEVVVDTSITNRATSDKIIWQLHPGKNSLKVQSVNTLGQKGIPAQIVVQIGM